MLPHEWALKELQVKDTGHARLHILWSHSQEMPRVGTFAPRDREQVNSCSGFRVRRGKEGMTADGYGELIWGKRALTWDCGGVCTTCETSKSPWTECFKWVNCMMCEFCLNTKKSHQKELCNFHTNLLTMKGPYAYTAPSPKPCCWLGYLNWQQNKINQNEMNYAAPTPLLYCSFTVPSSQGFWRQQQLGPRGPVPFHSQYMLGSNVCKCGPGSCLEHY